MDEESFERLIQDNLLKFQKADAKNTTNARYVRKALKSWNKEKEEYTGHFLDWWKEQDLQYISAFQSYLFYLWTVENKIDGTFFDETYHALTPILAKSWNMRIVITSDLSGQGFLTRKRCYLRWFSP